MKPYKLVIALLIVCNMFAKGQTDSSRIYANISLNGGLSVPAESFISVNNTTEIPTSFASVFVSYPLFNLKLGVIASYTNSTNSVNESTANGIDISGAFTENYMLGGIFSSYKNSDWVYSVRAMAGIIYIKTPGFSFGSYKNDFYPGGPSSFYETIDRSNDRAFAYEFGFTIGRLVTKHILLSFNTDIYNSPEKNGPNWNSESTSTSYVYGQAVTNYSYSKGNLPLNVTLACFSFGLGYQLGK
jgi:hypothetical protein